MGLEPGFFLIFGTLPGGQAGQGLEDPICPAQPEIFWGIVKEMVGKWILGGVPEGVLKSLGGWAAWTSP